LGEHHGISAAAVMVMMKEPARPAIRPAAVTPPFVPGGTTRKGLRIRRGGVRERMPSSEEKVSEATAA